MQDFFKNNSVIRVTQGMAAALSAGLSEFCILKSLSIGIGLKKQYYIGHL